MGQYINNIINSITHLLRDLTKLRFYFLEKY